MLQAAQDLGPFANLVGTAGALMSAAAAIFLAFKRRARWEPSEQDVDNGAQRVGGLLSAVAIASAWATAPHLAEDPGFVMLIGWLGGLTLLSLLVYGCLIGVLVFDKKVALRDAA